MELQAYIVVEKSDRYQFEQEINLRFLEGYRVKFYHASGDLTNFGAYTYTAVMERKGAK